MATHEEVMLEKFETLLQSAVGLKSVTVDGTLITYVDLELKWQFWKKQVARQRGHRPASARIRLGGF